MVKISKPLAIIIPNNWYVAATGILGRPRTQWKHYISWLAWEHLDVPPDKLEEVVMKRVVWANLPRLLPP